VDNTNNTGAATAAVSEQIKANYIGDEPLAGFEELVGITGLFWTQDGIGLFQPNDSTKVFEVSGDDVELLA
jgi:hypothetical protein